MKEVDFCCISDNYWLGKNKPCLTYGLRGVCYFFIEVECAAKDLHSGVFGGTVNEAMADLIWMMNQLLDSEVSLCLKLELRVHKKLSNVNVLMRPELQGTCDLQAKLTTLNIF